MTNVTAVKERSLIQLGVLGIFIYYNMFETSSNFYKLCVKYRDEIYVFIYGYVSLSYLDSYPPTNPITCPLFTFNT